MFENKRIKSLKRIYSYMRQVSVHKGNLKYEGVPMDWETFEDFVKDIWIKFYRALIKWDHYKRADGKLLPLKTIPIRLTRKYKSKGFTKDNVIFTSPSDTMKYREPTHKYMFENQLLGTRDIWNILKKRGIKIHIGTVSKRLIDGHDLFEPAINNKIKWKGKYSNFVEIGKKENVSAAILKREFYSLGNIQKAIDSARKSKKRTFYEFEGKLCSQMEICRIIGARLNMDEESVKGRFQKYGFNLEKLTKPNQVKLLDQHYEFEGQKLLIKDICKIIGKRLNMPADSIRGRFDRYGFDIEKLNMSIVLPSGRPSKKVLQCDINGNILKEWETIKIAANFLKTSASSISACCTGNQKTCAGFKWKHKTS